MKKPSKLPQGKSLRLKENHTWKAPDGFKVVVIDRGAVSFNIPQDWHVAKLEPFELNDQPPPDDNARVSVSFWRLPPDIDWTGLPLAQMLSQATHDSHSDLKTISRSEILRSSRADLEIVWTSHLFMDPKEHREAYSRIAVSRGWDIQVLITFDFWADDLQKSIPIWDEIIRSLQLGRKIEDPTKGAVLH
jgi:hypothetical protein